MIMTTITIDRALLEQALKAFESGLTMPKWSGIVADIRAELAKPAKASQTASQLAATVLSDCGISTDCTALLMVVEARIAQHEEEMIDSLQKLAKPVERVEPITLDQFRAIAHRTATTYRHRSDPEKSSYAFVDGSSLDDFWRKVCEAIQPTPAWHDAPETIALQLELASAKEAYLNACKLVAYMHAAAVGEVTGPRLGVVEDVAAIKAERDELLAAMKELLSEIEYSHACPLTKEKARAAISNAEGGAA